MRFESMKGLRLIHMLCVSLLLIPAAAEVGMSLDGYDVQDGTNAICWRTNLVGCEATPESLLAASYVLDKQENDVDMLGQCWPGLDMSVTMEPQGTAGPGVIYSDVEGFVRFDINFDPASVPNGLVLTPMRMIALRVKLCDISRIGFCTPFRRSRDGQNATAEALTDNILDGERPAGTGKGPRGDGGVEVAFALKVYEFTENADGTLSITALVPFKLKPHITGTYAVIGHAICYYGENTTDACMRLDMANALPERVYQVMQEKIVLAPTREYKIGISVVLAVLGLFELMLLGCLILYRKHPVIKLSQGPFLVLLITCSLIATLSCIMFIPLNDTFCNLWSPFILVSLSVLASTMTARMWRMYTLLSSTMRLSLMKKKPRVHEERLMAVMTFLANWDVIIGESTIQKWPRRSSSTSNRRKSIARQTIRKEVKNRDVLMLLTVLTVPQIVIQIVSLTRFPAQVVIVEHEFTSRVACQATEWWPTLVAVVLVGLQSVLTLVVAWVCRDLPSLFNEKHGVFRASCINFFCLLFAGLMVVLTDVETTSPNSRAFVCSVGTLCIALTPCYFVVFPKVMRARSGEAVVVSRLFDPASSEFSTATPTKQLLPDKCCLPNTSALTNDSEKKVVLGENDPPPRRIEYQLLALKDLIADFNESTAVGRKIPKSEWELLRYNAAALNTEMSLLEFDWDESEKGIPANVVNKPHQATSGIELFSTEE